MLSDLIILACAVKNKIGLVRQERNVKVFIFIYLAMALDACVNDSLV